MKKGNCRTVAIIQARMGSTRLPGKVLMDLGGATALQRVVTRLSRAERIDQIVIATTTSIADDAIVEASKEIGVEFFRGSEQDVLSRYMGAAGAFHADAVVRITSDCPLIDPGIVDRVVNEALAGSADFACNCLPRTYPRGLDTEFFSMQALRRVAELASQPHHREHVTPVFYERQELFRTHSTCAERDYSQYRWTLDTREDLELIRAIYAYFGNEDRFTWREVIGLMERTPELASINSHITQKSMYQLEAVH